jgi:thiaminase
MEFREAELRNTSIFSQAILEGSSDLLERIRKHPFPLGVSTGAIPDTVVQRWLTQNYILVRESERFLSILNARAPKEVRRPVFEAMTVMYGDMDVLEGALGRAGVDTSSRRMDFAVHAFVNYLFTAANTQTFGESLAAAYSWGYAFHEAWAAESLSFRGSRWADVIELWRGEGMVQWLDSMRKAIDATPESAPTALLNRMIEAFRISTHYEIRLFDMGLNPRD